MKLVVIEGPGKRDTLRKYLGSEYDVIATKGHVRDLPPNEFAIDLSNNFQPKYSIMSDKQEVIKDLKKKAKSAECVLLATDPDREGEAISWHIANILDIDPASECRIEFNEISKDVVQSAVKKPRAINQNLVNAQQARRVLDRIVGYKVSPIICRKIKPRLSAGRVQSVALELIVDREKEIENFVPKEYWHVILHLFSKNGDDKTVFKATLEKRQGKKIKLESKAQVDEVLSHLSGKEYFVSHVERKDVRSKPSAPFTTSTMQQDAQNKLGFDLGKTSKTAQVLYEGVNIEGEGKVALITYIRTDSTRVSEDAQKKARDFIRHNYGDSYYPSKTRVYATKASAQDAHEAIRPINLDRTPASLSGKIPNDALKLYRLIFERFLASQMSDAVYDSLNVTIKAGDCEFKASGKTLKFPGFMSVYKNYEEPNDDDQGSLLKIPPLVDGEVLCAKEIKSEQKFTKPPQRYTEASLVKLMEEKGIGRPATYAPTITTLFSREYTQKDGKAIVPTPLGRQVTEYLQQNFQSIMDIQFTAQMEGSLDRIADGEKVWQDVISKFWHHFQPYLDSADKTRTDRLKSEVVTTDIDCEICGSKMVLREGRYGKFLGCSNFPKCKCIKNLSQSKIEQEKDFGVCPKCGGKITEKHTKAGKVFYGCMNYPKCDYASWNNPNAIKQKKGE